MDLQSPCMGGISRSQSMSNCSLNTVVEVGFLKGKLTVAECSDSAIVLTTNDHVATYFQTRKKLESKSDEFSNHIAE